MVEIVIALLVGLDLILTAAVFHKLYGRTPEQKLDDLVELSMEEKNFRRRSREMDEGFDNLMRYEVRGMDGFGGG